MREFSKRLNDYLQNGLADQKLRINSPYFLSCTNLKVDTQGLTNVEDITNVDVGKEIAFPYPQLFNFPNYFLVLYSDGVYIADFEYDLTLIISIDNPLELIDFGELFIVTSLDEVKYISYNLNTFEFSEIEVEGPKFTTGVAYNNQLICGNINDDWEIDGTLIDVGDRGIVWSAIAEFNFNPVERVAAGYASIRYSDEVRKILQLGDFIIVYGNRSTIALRPYVEPVVTFGITDIKGLERVGISSQFSACSLETHHIFIDQVNNLWKLNSDLSVEKLDYKEHMKLLNTPHYLSSDLVNKDCYITDGTTSFVFSSQGLSSSNLATPSVTDLGGELIVSVDDYDDTIELITIPFDFDLRAQKTITEFDLGIDTDGVISVGVYWRMVSSAPFTLTPFKSPNPSGICPLIIAGVDFKLVIRITDYTYTDFNSLIVKVKYTDKRSIRGTYVS